MFNLCDSLSEQENTVFSQFKSNPNLAMNGIDFNNNSVFNNNHNGSRSLSDQPLFDSFFNNDSEMDHLIFNNQEEDVNRHDFMGTNNERIMSKMNTSDRQGSVVFLINCHFKVKTLALKQSILKKSTDSQLVMESNYNALTKPTSQLIMPNTNSHTNQQTHYPNFMTNIPTGYNFVTNNHNHPNDHPHNHTQQPHQQQPQLMPSFLSSSFTSNSCHNHSQTVHANKSTGRFGSNASSLSSNILLSSSSSSFSSFSSNFSNEFSNVKHQQKNLQQQYQSAFANNQSLGLQQRNIEYSNQLGKYIESFHGDFTKSNFWSCDP